MAANGTDAAEADELELDFDDIPATPPPPPAVEEGEEWLTPGESADFQNDPSGLVGKCVEVEGLGVGTVEGFNKAHNKLLYDSKHVVEFASGAQTILLRRRKMGKWNGGLNFKIISRETALEAELGDDFSIEDFDVIDKAEGFDSPEQSGAEVAPRQTDLQVLRRNSDMCPMPPPATGASRDALFFRRSTIAKARRSSSICSSISEGSATGTIEAEPAPFVPPPPPRPPPPPGGAGRRASLPPAALETVPSAFQRRMSRMATGQSLARRASAMT